MIKILSTTKYAGGTVVEKKLNQYKVPHLPYITNILSKEITPAPNSKLAKAGVQNIILEKTYRLLPKGLTDSENLSKVPKLRSKSIAFKFKEEGESYLLELPKVDKKTDTKMTRDFIGFMKDHSQQSYYVLQLEELGKRHVKTGFKPLGILTIDKSKKPLYIFNKKLWYIRGFFINSLFKNRQEKLLT